MSHPSGTTHGIGKTRHSPVRGFLAATITWAQANGSRALTDTDENFTSGSRTLSEPAATVAVPVIRSEPMKSEGAPGSISLRYWLDLCCGPSSIVLAATSFPERSRSDTNTVAAVLVDGFTSAYPP